MRCTQFRVIVVTDPQTHKHTNKYTGAITIHCFAASPARSVKIKKAQISQDLIDRAGLLTVSSVIETNVEHRFDQHKHTGTGLVHCICLFLYDMYVADDATIIDAVHFCVAVCKELGHYKLSLQILLPLV